jgi:CheY-like chemotaxis protein
VEYSLIDKSNALVLVVEPAASIRMMIMEVIRGLGYERVQGVGCAKDALSLLEIEDVQWLIMPLMANDSLNALQMIKLITIEPKLRGCATTLLLDPNQEEYCLPLAFELGLLSWHPRSYVKDNLQVDFEELLKIINSNDNNLTLTAAEYLRRFLSEKRLYRSRIALEQNLLAMYPGTATILIKMAEAELLTGNGTRASGLLRQAEVIDPKLSPVCQHLRDKHSKNLPTTMTERQENILGVKKVVIIDPDTDVLHATTEMLNKLGVTTIETFEDGQKAFEWFSASQEPDLIIMEWRIPGLSGPLLVQRLRQADFIQVPIIVMSSLIKREEKPLLAEMGVDEVLEKPFDQPSFFSIVIWAIQQNKMPTEQKSLERKIRRLMNANRRGEAERLLAQFLADPRMGEGAKKSIQAEFAYDLGDLSATCDLGAEALRTGGDSLAMLNLVGKALLKLGQYEKALRCLEKANAMCSLNIERILNIAEINLQLDRIPEARKAVNQAAALDADNPQLAETTVKIDLESGDVEGAAKGIAGLESVPRIASYINNRAVALSRSGRFEDAIALYRRAIQCLQGRNELAAVIYNLGLAYARYGEYEQAISTLENLNGDTSILLFKKAKALLKKVKLCIKGGTQLFADEEKESELPEADQESPTSTSRQHMEELVSHITAKRGDIGCFLVFHSIDEIDPKANDLIQEMPKFAKRKPISREETFGHALRKA